MLESWSVCRSQRSATSSWLIVQEMCFDCSNFQYQLDHKKPLEDHVFQTIFLNKEHSDTWQKDEIKKDKISESPARNCTLCR